MKQSKNNKGHFWILSCLSLLLILLGILMTVQSFTRYGQIFLRTQDDYLLHLAQSVDRNIDNLMRQYQEDLEYTMAQPDFLSAQNAYLQTGDTLPLLLQLAQSPFQRDELIVTLLALEDDKAILSTNQTTDYSFLSHTETGSLSLCVDSGGKVYLALTHHAEGGLVYAAMMDLDRFYNRLAGPAFSERNWILLTDANCQVLLYQQQKHAHVERVDGVTGATSGQEGVDILLFNQEQQISGTASYEYWDTVTQESYTARMAVVPSIHGENGVFAVGVVANFEADSAALNRTVVHLLFFGGMVVTGILLLAGVLLVARQKDERELDILRRKNEHMEALNLKLQDLAHHQRLETIGTLTSSIAHEFNNLLTPIMGYSIMVLEKIPPEEEEVYDSLLEIYQASQKAKTIISRLSDLSRKNTGLSYQYLSPNELARRVLDVAAPARPAKVDVQLESHCSEGACLHGNETQLSQLLLNLVLNGFHAMQERGGTLTLSTDSDESQIFLRVSDTGSGISPAVLPHVFDPFFTTKESGKGTGLGLPIVKQIVEEHKGNIDIQTEVGKGTTIRVTLSLHTKPELPLE